MKLLHLPFLLQGILMLYDEVLHRRRGLGAWERMGHPLDTFTVFVPLAFAATRDFTEARLWIFVLLGIFSSIFITKDEFVHARECGPREHWVHAVLFVLHPLIFVAAGFLWWLDPADLLLGAQPLVLGGFMTYQIIYWSYVWKPIAR